MKGENKIPPEIFLIQGYKHDVNAEKKKKKKALELEDGEQMESLF